jgi:hypothetical protein
MKAAPLLALMLAGLLCPPALPALDARSIVRLKKAGVGDATIAAMAAERSVETGAFTVEEVIAMKAAGVGEETLKTLITAGSFLRNREPVVTGNDLRPLRLSTAEDIIRLKQAGVGDAVLQAVVEAGRPASEAERERALRMLEAMGFWVDYRDR